jgi:Holliday junction DNA helicase RuvA
MIALLRGRLAEKQPNRIIVDVAGVGYDVSVPLSTFYKLGEPGAEVELRIHTHVREDALALYGFATAFELQIFERLIATSGIGPKLALSVLSGIEPADLVRAVQTGDVARLTAIPGVGKKTAERICLELKDRLPTGIGLGPDAGRETEGPGEDLRRDLLSALLNLGYHLPPAEKAVDRALRRVELPTFELVLKQALRELARVS